MHYVSVSFTHKNTDIELREKLSFANIDRRREILRLLSSSENIEESMALSTCNRVEILAVCEDVASAQKHILNSISLLTLVSVDALELRADIYEDQGAIHHLFAVASSLDSLVVGETQIAGQLKEAFKFAYDYGNAGENIASAMHFAFKCAANIRATTQISKNPVSVSSVSVAKAKEIFGNIGGMTAVVVGAGEMASLACKHLISSDVNVIILNRDEQKAKELCKSLGELASYDKFSKLAEYVNRYRLFFSATASPEPIIVNSLVEPREFDRYFFDIAVPRDIDLNGDERIHVYAVDDLEEIVKTNLALREEQANVAYAIVAKSVGEFFKWILNKGSTPLIKALRGRAKEVAEEQIAIALKKGYLKRSDENEAKKLVHQVFKAFLHTPSVKLKDKNDREIRSALEYLFDIEIKKDEHKEE